MAPFDVRVIGELNLDLILYGTPQSLVLEREHLAADLSITLGSSSAIFAHNLSYPGNRVGFSPCIGDDPFGEICVQRLSASGGVSLTKGVHPGHQTWVQGAVGRVGKEKHVAFPPVVDVGDPVGAGV